MTMVACRHEDGAPIRNVQAHQAPSLLGIVILALIIRWDIYGNIMIIARSRVGTAYHDGLILDHH